MYFLKAGDTGHLLVHTARQVAFSRHRNARTGEVLSVAERGSVTGIEAEALSIIVEILVIQVQQALSGIQGDATAPLVAACEDRTVLRLGDKGLSSIVRGRK